MGRLLANPLRKLFENPRKLVGPHIEKGMTVLEPGPGMGFFTLPMARMVGPEGKVVAVDLSQEMLTGLSRRAAKAGLAERIECRECRPERLGLEDLAGKVDLATVIHVVHEVVDQEAFFTEILATLKPGGRLLVVEPKSHVSDEEFAESVVTCVEIGFKCLGLEVRQARFTKPGD